jgi:hypothetical protein
VILHCDLPYYRCPVSTHTPCHALRADGGSGR